MAENRIDLLQGKNELTTEELYRIIEFKHEFSSNDFLKKYTEKPFRKLNSEEKSKLVEELLKADYLNYKKCYIARSKLLYDTSETLEKEISIIEKLNDLGYEVYLLPYGYARDSMNCYLKSADSITNGNFLEFKTVISTGKYAGQSVYAEGRKQADNIFISLLNETSEQKVVNNIYKVINEKKRLNKLTNREEDFSGLIYLNFEKNNKTVLYRFEKDGKALRLDNPTFDNLKKCLSDIANTQVQENPITEYGSSPQKSINEGNLSVNNFLKVFGGSKVSLNYDGKNIQGKIMLSDGDSVEIEPFEISESELNDCWYGFTYKGKDFDMNISLNDTENEGTPVCIYPVINGTTLTTSDFAAIKKDSVFFEKQIANEIINNQMENKTMEKILTWDEIYRAAEGKVGEDWALKVYDNARAYIGSYAKEHFGIDIEASEIPEDAIDDFLKEHPELNRFNESGQMLAEINSENEILNKPFIPSEYVLNKLQEKGIEVVTDKKVFERILESQAVLQKMATSLSDLKKLSASVKKQEEAISNEQEKSKELAEKESAINSHSFSTFVLEMQKYQDIFQKNDFIKLDNLNYFYDDSTDFELFIGKNSNNNLILTFNCNTPGYLHDFEGLSFYDITNNTTLIGYNSEKYGYGGFNYSRIAPEILEKTKEYIANNDYVPLIQDNLKDLLESHQIKEKAILANLIEKNNERKNFVESRIDQISREEKRNAEKTLESWLNIADEMEDSLWNKDQLQVKKIFTENGTEERKPIAVISESDMQIFKGVKDHNLYADKSYIVDHYINRHHNARTFLNIQNVLDNYDNIYFDKDQNSTGFTKKYGKMIDCVFMRVNEGKIILFGTTFEQPEYKIENGIKRGRFEKITPARKQEQNMSLEGSTPLSHNSIDNNEKAAVAISDVNDNSNISQPVEKSSNMLEDGSMFITQMKTEEIKANISVRTPSDIVPHLENFANSEVENFGVVLLDASYKVKEIRAVTVGTINRSLVHAREVFKEAVRNSAAAVLIFHNHPSGNVAPSSEDINTTQKLMEASDIIGIPVLDHIIVSKEGYFSFEEHNMLNARTQNFIHDGTTYGFAHNGKIYLNSDVLSAEAAMHEYTHLWDNLTRKENPMLWNKGLEIFKGTSIWNEVINDEHYQDIKDDENLVLSECHARITGKVAEAVLNRIAELDGNEKQADMINWDKETINFIFENYRDIFEKNSFNSVADFTSATMKDLFGPMEQQKRDRKTEFTQASDMDLKLKVSELGFFMKLDAGWLLQDELAGSYAKEIVKDLNNNYFVIDNEAEEGSPDENPKPLDKVLLKSLVSEVIESIKMRNDEKLNVYSSNFDVGFTNAYESLVNLQREFEVESSQNKPFIPSDYVLNKLQEKGIEVITDKAKFNELLKASEILQIMEGDKKENLSDKYFQANQSEAEAFSKELDAFIADYDKTQKTINPLKMLNVGSITPVMKLLGIADVPVGIDQSTISKALREEPIYPDDEQGHKLTIDELKNIPQSLADPVMVFRSDSPTRRNKDSYVFFTEQRDFKNRSIIIPVAVNKKYGRLVINKVTSIYGRNQEIRYVKDNIQRGNLVYFDKKRSLEWERECKVQFLAQVLPIEGSINNILSKDSLVKFLDSKSEKMVKDGTTYGFAHNGKIYLNSDVLSAEAAMHEYTHLWDNLTRKENPMLWNKGLEIFKGTSIWNEVINDEHYQDIKDDENLVLSECHARITGKVAEAVLNRIAELDGNEKQADMINWDKETINFIFENYRDVFEKNSFNSVAEFTTATMKDLFSPVEQQKRDVSINSSAFERMEKLFEGKHSELGNKDYQTFPELYDFIKEEFPNQNTLLEAVSRMVHSNVNFGDLEPASYDDVYGVGDGAEQRFDVSDDIAKRLINNEITPDWMTIQNEVNDFARRKFMDLKENNPDMLLTDSINEAFEISKKYNPLAEKDLNAYTKSEKTQNIQKALENIEKTYTEDSHDIRIDYGTGIFGADLEALIKGNDAAIYGEKSLDFVRPDRVSLELGIEDKIPFKDLIRGYGDNFASALLFDSEGAKVPRHIERWDYMEVFDSDYDAAQQWKLETGGKLLENGKNIWISDENLEHLNFPDTPENRVALKEYLLPRPLEFNWDNFTEEQFNAVKEEITSGNIKEDYKGQVYVGSVCVEFTITDKESCWVDYNNYILGEKGEGEISGIPYSYQNGEQVVMNTFTENSYENFKTVIENVLIEDMGKDSHLKQEAMRKTINWTTINENNKEAALKLWKEKEGITEEELEHIREQITYNIALTNLDFNNEEHVQKVKEMFGKDFDVSNDEAKVLLSYATCFGDGTHEYGLSKDGHLHFRTNQDNEGWSFITEDSMLTDFLTSAFDGAAILLDSDKTNDATLLNSFLNKNQTLLNDLDNNKLYELSLIDIKSKLQEIDENTKNFIVTHSVTFPCGFTFPPDLNNEAEMDAYRESQIEKIKEKYGCNDNEIESEIFDIDDPKNASFNIHFAVPVPEEISDNLEKVNEWIEGVENFVKEECGCTFINWQGGERNETVYENAKEYKMEKERKSDFANPNAEIMNVLSDALADSFNTLDYNPDYWQNLLDRGADPTRAIRIAAADANLADNLNWLLDNVPDERLKEIFSDKSYADEVFDIAKESVIHDEDSWQHIGDVGFAGFKRIAVLCERETEADRYYGECLEKLYKVPVEPKISQLLDTPELLAGKMNSNRIHQNEPEITESLAKAILDYCTFENIKFYCDNNEDIFSLDVSEDYTGEGMKESNFGIAANGIEYANKAKDYAYSIYNEETYNVVKDLWEKEKIFANPAQTQNEKQISFINDEEKMKDFPNISKEEFLSSYSYLSEEEYDATAKDYNELNQAAVPSRFSDTVKTVEDINKIYDRNLDFIEQNISFKYSNPQFNEIDEIEKWKNGELFIPLEDRNGNYTTDTEANTLEEYNSYANKNFKTYFEVIKYQAELKAKFLDSAIENSITEYLRREYAETSPNSARFEVTVENQSYPIDKEGLDFITDTNEWGSADDRLNEVIDRRFEEEIEQKEIDIVSDVLEYISQETNGNLVLKNTELSDVLFSDELIQIYSPKQEFLAIQPEETKAALIEAGIARGELYNNVEKEYDATANELKEHGRTGLQTVKALAYKNVMDKNYLAYDNRLEKSGSEADKIQSAIERLTDVSLPAVAGEIGKSEQEVAEIISALLDAKDYVEERFNVVRPTADEIIEKVRDEVSWADILKTELSWKELGLNPEDYDRTESGTETEKDFKEWAMGLELENALDLHGFDTALEGVSSWNNSTISEQKWMIIDKLSEEIVSGKLKIENSQDAFDKLLKENEVYKGFVQKGIVKDDVFGLREITEKDLKSVSAKEPVSEKARDEMLSANFAGHGGLTQKAFADNGIEIDIETANALENCFSQIEAITKYTADGHDLFKEGNGVDTISERSIEYSEKEKAWIIHEKNWLALSAIKGNEAAPDDYMEKADRAVDRNWSINCEELVKLVYNEIKEDGEIEKEFPDTFKKLENLKDYTESLTEAKQLISDFCFDEYMSTPTFDNLKDVGLAYTTFEDPYTHEEYEIQTSADLVNCEITTKVNDKIADSMEYDSLKDMVINSLNTLDFDNLVYVPSSKLDELLKEERESVEKTLLEKSVQIIAETFNEPALAKRAKLYVPSDYGYDADNKIHILVEFDNNAKHEDDLFNALAERHLVLPNGREVDFNPIKPEKSGTIEQYLDSLEKIKLGKVVVSKENFRKVFNEVIKLPKYKDKPLEAAGFCFSRVPKENKAEVAQWLSNLGCKTKIDTNDLFNKWNMENNPKPNINKSINKSKSREADDWSISD